MTFNPKRFFRKVHYWVAIVVLVPFLVMLVSGVLLQFKKHVAWIQPPTQRGHGQVPQLSFEQVLESCRGVSEAEIATWDDIERLDVRPDRGLIKVKSDNGWEIQLDHTSGEVLHVALRRSDLIEDIHDGSFFHSSAKFGVFLPTAIGMGVLSITGLYLFILPIWARRKSRQKRDKAFL